MRPTGAVDLGIVTTIEFGVTSASEHARDAINKAVSTAFAEAIVQRQCFAATLPTPSKFTCRQKQLESRYRTPVDHGIRRNTQWSRLGTANLCPMVDEHAIGKRAAELLHQMRRGERALTTTSGSSFRTLYAGETLGPATKG